MTDTRNPSNQPGLGQPLGPSSVLAREFFPMGLAVHGVC